jgi:inner membrane protein
MSMPSRPEPANRPANAASAFSGHAVKLLILGIGWVALTVLLAMIGDLVSDREGHRIEAEHRVAAGWGGRQSIGAPLLRLRYAPTLDNEGNPQPTPDRWLSADRAGIDAVLNSETRRLGLFGIPVYQTDLTLTAEFGAERLRRLLAHRSDMPIGVELMLPLSDPRGLRSAVSLTIAGVTVRLVPVAGQLAGQRLLGAELPLDLLSQPQLKLSGEFALAGVQSLHTLPSASELTVALRGDWPDPGFASGLLPRQREVSEQGFSAQWQVFDFNTGMPQQFNEYEIDRLDLGASRIGVELQQPGEIYQRNERAWKYGTLFVALTLAAWFLIELLLRRNLWALDYALIGVSQVCFYLLLLALSEHLGFALAYLIAAIVFAGMVGAFSIGLLGSRRRGLSAGAVLGGGYGALYLLIGSESYALLLGALLITGLIATAMGVASRLRLRAEGVQEQG